MSCSATVGMCPAARRAGCSSPVSTSLGRDLLEGADLDPGSERLGCLRGPGDGSLPVRYLDHPQAPEVLRRLRVRPVGEGDVVSAAIGKTGARTRVEAARVAEEKGWL
jgi:hypothetical protein